MFFELHSMWPPAAEKLDSPALMDTSIQFIEMGTSLRVLLH